MLANLRKYMAGEISTREIRSYIDGLDDAGYEPVNLPTYEQSEAQEIVGRCTRTEHGVSEYLQQNWEMYEYDGSWNEAAVKH